MAKRNIQMTCQVNSYFGSPIEFPDETNSIFHVRFRWCIRWGNIQVHQWNQSNTKLDDASYGIQAKFYIRAIREQNFEE